MQIAMVDGDFEVPAELIAHGLDVPLEELLGLMRTGAVTSRCERGIEQDAGHHRLTFFHKARRLRLIVDSDGRLIRRTAIDAGDLPVQSALRRP